MLTVGGCLFAFLATHVGSWTKRGRHHHPAPAPRGPLRPTLLLPAPDPGMPLSAARLRQLLTHTDRKLTADRVPGLTDGLEARSAQADRPACTAPPVRADGVSPATPPSA